MAKKRPAAKAAKNTAKTFDRAFHDGPHDLEVNPANDGTRLQPEGAGCYGGSVDLDNPVVRLHRMILEFPNKEFEPRDLARFLGMRMAEARKPIGLAVQGGLLKKSRRDHKTYYSKGRSA